MIVFKNPRAKLFMVSDGMGGMSGGDSTEAAASDDGAASSTIELPKTPEELTKLISDETARALKVSEEKLKQDYETRIETEKAEAARLAKLTADEREKEIEKKKREELDQREATIRNQELTLKATEMLSSKGLPLEIRSMMIGKDESDTKLRIETFEGLFQKAVANAVNQKLSSAAKPAGGEAKKDEAIRNEIAAAING